MSYFGRDTSPETERMMIELMRNAPVARKMEALFGLVHLARGAARAGLRGRHPEATPAETEWRLAALLYGEALAEAAYGPIEDAASRFTEKDE